MNEAARFTAELVRKTRQAYAKKWSFLGLFVLILLTSVLVLGWLDLLPDSPSTAVESESQPAKLEATTTLIAPVVVEAPVRIEIASLGLAATIENPETTNATVLDKLLLKGAVRYPTSAKLGEAGNVVLFGHSSYLPVVGNKAYKTFNEIQKLEAGDMITVYSSGRTYTYAVRTVEKQNAEEGAIPLMATGRVLTLATCDSFGKKSDRFVVTADFVESYPVGA
jgi:LPXTG-site transpeptidase (sortase) family protein